MGASGGRLRQVGSSLSSIASTDFGSTRSKKRFAAGRMPSAIFSIFSSSVLDLLVCDDLCFSVRERLLVLRALDEFDLFVRQPIEAVYDLVDERIRAGEVALDGDERFQRLFVLALDFAFHIAERDDEAVAVLVQSVVELTPGEFTLALLIIAQVALKDGLACQTVNTTCAIFIRLDFEPLFDPYEEAFDLLLLMFVEVDHALC